MASINTGPHINPKYTTDHPYCKDSQKRANSGKAPLQATWSVPNLYDEHVDWRCNTFEVFGSCGMGIGKLGFHFCESLAEGWTLLFGLGFRV